MEYVSNEVLEQLAAEAVRIGEQQYFFENYPALRSTDLYEQYQSKRRTLDEAQARIAAPYNGPIRRTVERYLMFGYDSSAELVDSINSTKH
jgi:hypothetical protein